MIRCFAASSALISTLLLAAPASAQPDEALAREMLEELIASNTAPSGGPDTREAVALLVEPLLAAGFAPEDISTLGVSEELPSLIVRYRSPDPQAGAVLMMAHIDVVEALESDWSYPPYEATEEKGYIYGRGSTDNKAGAAILVANFIALKREGFEPDRDLIVMLTADEETTGASADFFATERRDLIDADFALNTDGGLVAMGNDGPEAFIMQTAEKVYAVYELTATDPGGHSSVPRADSPISRLARTLVAIEEEHFPINLNETSRRYFEQWSPFAAAEERDIMAALARAENGTQGPVELAQFPYFNSLARTTCVATMLEGGHAENALPQTAKAVVNCRIVPQQPAAEVEAMIQELAEPNGVAVESTWGVIESPPSPLIEEVVGPVSDVAARFWPGIPIVPEMSTGATDGAYLRRAGIPVYGVGAIAEKPGDIRAHGMDERIGIESFNDSLAYWYELTKQVASGN